MHGVVVPPQLQTFHVIIKNRFCVGECSTVAVRYAPPVLDRGAPGDNRDGGEQAVDERPRCPLIIQKKTVKFFFGGGVCSV